MPGISFVIEAVAPVTNAVVSLDWNAGWNGGMVDRVRISAIDLDLDVDSSNDGEIAGDDDPIERDNPGRVIHAVLAAVRRSKRLWPAEVVIKVPPLDEKTKK